MVTDQNHSSDSTPIEQEVSRYEKIAKRIADMDSALSEKMGALDEKMDNYYSSIKSRDQKHLTALTNIPPKSTSSESSSSKSSSSETSSSEYSSSSESSSSESSSSDSDIDEIVKHD
ncbi:uncharacterized protein OCT59_023210 [Rhizophagus irregularis]|uniref:uncharacterized protein n=1 Tax=Rhizophagus irregularis TaxID=588596 RepID=UPI003321753A|nr:hypothetical protein OCT59_023210 [Rhizophagus irregularis]